MMLDYYFETLASAEIPALLEAMKAMKAMIDRVTLSPSTLSVQVHYALATGDNMASRRGVAYMRGVRLRSRPLTQAAVSPVGETLRLPHAIGHLAYCYGTPNNRCALKTKKPTKLHLVGFYLWRPVGESNYPQPCLLANQSFYARTRM
jgi:hypothetical protein